MKVAEEGGGERITRRKRSFVDGRTLLYTVSCESPLHAWKSFTRCPPARPSARIGRSKHNNDRELFLTTAIFFPREERRFGRWIDTRGRAGEPQERIGRYFFITVDTRIARNTKILFFLLTLRTPYNTISRGEPKRTKQMYVSDSNVLVPFDTHTSLSRRNDYTVWIYKRKWYYIDT